MIESLWLTELREWAARQALDDDPTEQLALGAQELLASVPNNEIVAAYEASSGEPNHLVADALAAVMQHRNLDLKRRFIASWRFAAGAATGLAAIAITLLLLATSVQGGLALFSALR